MECTFYADGENYVINGKKWWSSGESFSFNGFKKKKEKKSLFFTLELIRFCEIQDSVNKQLHCCQDQLALNYYWK